MKVCYAQLEGILHPEMLSKSICHASPKKVPGTCIYNLIVTMLSGAGYARG